MMDSPLWRLLSGFRESILSAMAKTESTHQQMLDQVRQEIQALESQLAVLRAVEQYHAHKASGDAEPAVVRLTVSPVTIGGAPRFTNMNQTDAAVEVLREAGRPLSTADIAKALVQGGVRAKAPDRLKASLFPAMQRKPAVFRKAGPGLWALADGGRNGTMEASGVAEAGARLSIRRQVFAVATQYLSLDQLADRIGRSKKQVSGVLFAPDIKDRFEHKIRGDGTVEYRLRNASLA
jgi:hypothetical protein